MNDQRAKWMNDSFRSAAVIHGTFRGRMNPSRDSRTNPGRIGVNTVMAVARPQTLLMACGDDRWSVRERACDAVGPGPQLRPSPCADPGGRDDQMAAGSGGHAPVAP